MDLGKVNQQLKDDIAQLQQDKANQLDEMRQAEEKLKAQIAQIKKERDEALQEIETINGKLNQRDTQIKRLLTENAGYLNEIDEVHQNLKAMQTDIETQMEEIEFKDSQL